MNANYTYVRIVRTFPYIVSGTASTIHLIEISKEFKRLVKKNLYVQLNVVQVKAA